MEEVTSLNTLLVYNLKRKIADTKLVWTKPREKNDKQMPPIKFIGNHFKIKKRKYLIFIEEPSWKYPVRFEKGSSFKKL